jgi:26S proteasome regulatory subunit N8
VTVTVDVHLQIVGIPTDAYFAVEEIEDVRGCHSVLSPISLHCISYIYASGTYSPLQDGTGTRKRFLHAPSAIEAEEAEKIGIEHFLRDIKDLMTMTLTTCVSEQPSLLQILPSPSV